MCKRTRLNTMAILAVALIGLSASVAQAGFFDFMYPEKLSNHVENVDPVFDYINWVTLISFVGIVVVMVGFAIKYRRKDPTQKALSQASHSTALEIGWSVPPFIIVIVMFFMGFEGWMATRTAPRDVYEVQVVGQKWSWRFKHPNGHEETGILEIPSDRPVKLTLTSKDVLHSVSIPAFRVKRDAVPRRLHQIWFQTDQTTKNHQLDMPEGEALDDYIRASITEKLKGERNAKQQSGGKLDTTLEQDVAAQLQKMSLEQKQFEARDIHLKTVAAQQGHILYCTEYCGQDHSMMLARVVVHDRDWMPSLQPEPTGVSYARGKMIYEGRGGCVGCHSIDGSKKPGPTFKGLFGRMEKVRMPDGSIQEIKVDADYLRESIANPNAKVVEGFQPVMPPQPMFDGTNQDEKDALESLILYIQGQK